MNLKIGLQDVNRASSAGRLALIFSVAAACIGGPGLSSAAARSIQSDTAASPGAGVSPAATDTLARHNSEALTEATHPNAPEGWLGYLEGSSLRKECGSSPADSYRFVYNADFKQQVRTYDLTIPRDPAGPATLVSRVISHGGGSQTQSSDRALFSYQSSVWAQRTIARGLAHSVLQALSKSGFGEPVQSQASLRSDSFYWIVSACVAGRFQMSAWSDLARRGARPAFAQELFSLDETAVPIRAPKSASQTQGFWGELFSPPPAAKARTGGGFKVELTGGEALTVAR